MLQVGLYCQVEGCDKRPSEGKPFCSRHVVLMPYAKFLLGQHARMQNEIDEISKGGVHKIDMQRSHVVRWILNALHINGPLTAERAARETGIPKDAVKRCVRRMLKEGMLEERVFHRDIYDTTKKLVPLVDPSSDEVAELVGTRADIDL